MLLLRRHFAYIRNKHAYNNAHDDASSWTVSRLWAYRAVQLKGTVGFFRRRDGLFHPIIIQSLQSWRWFRAMRASKLDGPLCFARPKHGLFSY